VGERVRIVPNHVCPVVNLFDRLVLVRGDRVRRVLPVATRGAVA
jgi:D-serine deaminase-like pyridoxal phosphate-dependent protein